MNSGLLVRGPTHLLYDDLHLVQVDEPVLQLPTALVDRHRVLEHGNRISAHLGRSSTSSSLLTTTTRTPSSTSSNACSSNACSSNACSSNAFSNACSSNTYSKERQQQSRSAAAAAASVQPSAIINYDNITFITKKLNIKKG